MGNQCCSSVLSLQNDTIDPYTYCGQIQNPQLTNDPYNSNQRNIKVETTGGLAFVDSHGVLAYKPYKNNPNYNQANNHQDHLAYFDDSQFGQQRIIHQFGPQNHNQRELIEGSKSQILPKSNSSIHESQYQYSEVRPLDINKLKALSNNGSTHQESQVSNKHKKLDIKIDNNDLQLPVRPNYINSDINIVLDQTDNSKQ